MADGLDIGGLAGRIEFEDHVSFTLDQVVKKLDAMEEAWDRADDTVKDSAKGFLMAEVSLKAVETALATAIGVVKDLTIEGSAVASVTENFARLSSEAGHLGETLLGEVRTGTHETISDLELIKIINQDLAAGMNLTDAQFRTMADGAFALAQATGGDVKEALDQVNQAMLTGQVRSIAALTGKIDLAQAEQDFAAKLGTTADRLTQEGKTLAARNAILDSVSDATKRLGDQEDGLGEIVAQAQTRWANFYNELGASIATSPEVVNSFKHIEDALFSAFGAENDEAIKNITRGIDGLANVISAVGPPVIDVLGKIAGGFGWFASGLAEDISSGQDLVQKWSMVVMGFSEAEAEAAVATYRQTEEMIRQGHEADKNAQAEKEAAAAMKARADQEAENARITEHNRLVIQQTTEEIKKRRDAMTEIESVTNTYHETVSLLDQDMVVSIKNYLAAGVAQDKLATAYGLTATQLTAIVKVMKDEDIAQKLAAKQASDSQARWEQFYAARIEMSGRATDAVIADIQRWEAAQVKSHVDAKTDTADFYSWLELTTKQMQERADQERLLTDQHSKAYWVQQKVDAEDAYQFALAHADQFTSGYIDMLAKTKDAATDAAEHWENQLGSELDDLTEKVDRLKGAMEFGGSFEVTSQNFAQALHSANTFGNNVPIGHFDEALAYNMARKGYSFEEIIKILESKGGGPVPPPKGPRIPGFRDGGVGDFGEGTLAVLHGKEAIVPLDGPGGVGVGKTVNNFYVNGTAEDVARKIGDILMRNYRMGRQVASS